MSAVDLFGVVMSTEAFVSMVGEIVVAFLLILAVVIGLKHKGVYHHYILLIAYLSDELVFKVIMYSRLRLGVFGDFPYAGTMAPLHISLAVLVTVLGLAAVALGFKYRIKKDRKMFMPPRGMKWHKPIGILYVVFWFVSFLDGIYIFRSFYL